MANIMSIETNDANRHTFFKNVVEQLRPIIQKTDLPTDAQEYKMVPSAADGDFNKWLVNGDTRKAVEEFIAKLPDTEKGNRLRELANTYFELERELNSAAAELSRPEEQRVEAGHLEAIQEKLSTLMTGDAFHEAIEAYNADSKGKFAESNGMKILINMSLRLDQAAAAMDTIVCDTYAKTVADCTDEVELVNGAIKRYQDRLTEEHNARKAVGFGAIDVQAEYDKDSKTIEELDAQMEAQFNQIQELTDRQVQMRKEIDDAIFDQHRAEEHLAAVKHGIEVKIPADIQAQKDLIAGVAEFKNGELEAIAAQDARISELNNTPMTVLLEGKTLPNTPKAVEYMRKLHQLDTLDRLAENLKFSTMTDFRNVVFPYADDKPTRWQEKMQNTVRDFYGLYAEYQPDKSGIMGWMSSVKSSEKLFHELDEKHSKDLTATGLNKDFRRMITTMHDKVIEDCKALLSEPDVKEIRSMAAKERKAQIQACQDQIQHHMARIDEKTKETRAARTQIEYAEQQQARMQEALPKAEAAVKNAADAVAAKKSELAAMAEQIQNLQKSRVELGERKANVQEHQQIVSSLSARARVTDDAKRVAVETVEQYRTTPKPTALPQDRRAARINERAATFLAHQSDCAKGHKNTPEYNRMIEALLQVRDCPANQKANALNLLGEAAHAYQKAKGTRTVFASELRHTRLNFARNIECWAKSTAASLEKPLVPMDSKIASEDAQFRSDAFLTGLKGMDYRAAQRARANSIHQPARQMDSPEMRQRSKSVHVKASEKGPVIG